MNNEKQSYLFEIEFEPGSFVSAIVSSDFVKSGNNSQTGGETSK